LNSVRRSVWLTFADSYFGLVLQIASTMVIARILTPQEIGVFAIAAVFSTLASMFRDFGVAEYLIQERELTRDKIAAALALNITVSWAMAAAMFFGAPFAAQFYGYPGVAHVMYVQAIGFLLVPFGAVTMAWFRRELDYRPVIICNTVGNVTSFATAVSMALAGFGVMALAWSTVAGIAATVALSVWFRPASLPRWPSLRGVGEVFQFSKFVSLMYIVGQVAKGLPEMIIGRALGAVEVAMFSRGNGLVELFARLISRSVFVVCMPYLAKADREEGSIARAYANGVSYLTAVGWPFIAFLGIAAYSAIRIVYGPQWDAAVPIAQILCLACALEITHCMSREAMLTRGLAKQGNNLQTILTVVLGVGLLVGVQFGLEGAAWGTVAYSATGIAISHRYLARYAGLRAIDLWKACLPSLAITLVTVAPVGLWAAVQGVGKHNFVVFGVLGGVITAVSWLVAIHLFRHPLVAELEPIKRRLLALRPST